MIYLPGNSHFQWTLNIIYNFFVAVDRFDLNVTLAELILLGADIRQL